MPKKSQKSKSKRMTLKQKYKIKKKVKEHARKKKKQEKKLGIKPKGPKDPGLPAQWPFKEELIKEFAFKRAQILADEKAKKEERRARQRMAAAAAAGDGDEHMEGDGEGEEGQALLRLQASAANKQVDFETRKRARLTADFQSDKDNSKKAFYKEFKKVVELADVVIQVLDARDPLACRCPDVERYIRSTNPNKRVVLLLNKMDLVPREVGEQWLKYFREELPTVAFKCNTQQQADRLGRKKMPKRSQLDTGAGALQSSNCLGADTLIQLLKNYCRNTGIKTAITVGVVGLPNVGKSSLINSLKRARVAQVGNTPGVTKALQEVHLDKNIKLLDSPGIVFAAAEDDSAAVLRNCVKIERLKDPAGPVAEILKRVPAKPLMALYKIGAYEGPDQFLQQVAQARGKLRKGGIPDMPGTAKLVLQDWYDGRIPYFTRPPSRGNEAFASAEVVASWASEFDAEQVFANEKSAVIEHLPAMDGAGDQDGAAGAQGAKPKQYFQLESLGGAKVDLESMDADDEEQEDNAGGMEHDGDDGDDSVYGLPTKKAKSAAAGAAASGALLYGEEGQFNPHAARAEKKKAKKGDKAAVVAAAIAAKANARGAKGAQAAAKVEDGDDEDFEFEAGSEDEGEGEEGSDGGEGAEDEDGMESD